MADPKRPDNNPPKPPVNPDGATVVVPLKDLARPPAAPADEGGVTTTVDLKQVFGGDLAKVRAEILAQLNRKAPAEPPVQAVPEPPAPPPPEPPAAAAPPEPSPSPAPEIPTTATVPAPPAIEIPPPAADSPMTIIAEAPSPEEIALMKAAAGWAKAGMKREPPPPSREPQTEVIENRSTAPAGDDFKMPADAGEATIVSFEPVYGEPKAAAGPPPMDAGDATIIASDSAPYVEQPWGGAPAGEETIVSPGIEKELRAQAAPRPAAPVDADATIVQAPIAKEPEAAAKKPDAAPKAGGAFWGGAAPAAPAAPKPEPAAAKAEKPAPPPVAKPAPPPVQAKPAPPPPKPAPVPAPPQQQAAPPPPKRRKKSSRTPLIVAVVVIFLASIVAVALFVMKDYKLSETPVSQAANVTAATETAPPSGQAAVADGTTANPEPVREAPSRATSEAAEENVDKMLAEVKAAQPAPPPPPIRRRVVLPPPVRTEPLAHEPKPAETSAPPAQQPARTNTPATASTLPPLEGDLVPLTEPGLTPPVLRNDEPAKYPGRARMAGAKGTVTIAIQVDQNGGVRDANIAKSSGNSLLDNAALTAARRTTWSPATVKGTRVRVWVTKQYTFGQ